MRVFCCLSVRDLSVAFSFTAGLLFVDLFVDLSLRLNISRWKCGIPRQAGLVLDLWPILSLPAFRLPCQQCQPATFVLEACPALVGIKRCSLYSLARSLRSSQSGAPGICIG